MKKIKKFKIKQNSNNEYSNYHYFIPKSEHIKFADARTLDTEIGDLRNQINKLEEKTQYLIDKAPLIGFGTGENITLRGCANSNFRKFEIEGNSKQETREGYNFYDKRLAIVRPNVPQNIETTPFPIKKNTTYTFYAKGQDWLEVRFYDENSNMIDKKNNGQHVYIMTFTTPENTKTIKLTFYAEPNVNLSTYDFTNVMLLEGTYTVNTLPPYEPYGAMPSLEFESPVKVAMDHINIFDINTLKVQNDKRITSELLNIEANTKYTISTDLDLSKYQYAFIYDSSQNTTGWLSVNEFTFKFTETSIRILIRKIDDTNITLDEIKYKYKFKLEKGPKATPYSPYGMGSAEINVCNKNFANIDKVVQSSVIKLEGNTIHVKNSTGQALFYTTIFKNLDLPFDEYTISVNNLSGTYKAGNIMIQNIEDKDIGEAYIETYKKRF